jgi:hypothetical protein
LVGQEADREKAEVRLRFHAVFVFSGLSVHVIDA